VFELPPLQVGAHPKRYQFLTEFMDESLNIFNVHIASVYMLYLILIKEIDYFRTRFCGIQQSGHKA